MSPPLLKAGQPGRSASTGRKIPEIISGFITKLGTDTTEDERRARHARISRAFGAEIDGRPDIHIHSIGLSDYVETAPGLALDHAAKDAEDLIKGLQAGLDDDQALSINQKKYATRFYPLIDNDARGDAIRRSLTSIRDKLARSGTGEEVVLVHFSGHGATIDGGFFLFPYAIRDTDPHALVHSSISAEISADDFDDYLKPVGVASKLTVFVDACRTSITTGAGHRYNADARRLKSILSANNVNLFMSSSEGEDSVESSAWENAAFDESVLKALGGAVDSEGDGVVGLIEIANHIEARVPEIVGEITDRAQTPTIEIPSNLSLEVLR